MECGFDKLTVEPVSEPGLVETPAIPVTPVEPSISTQEVKPGCPRCGTELDAADRFCPECGFDTTTEAIENQTRFKPVEQPGIINQPPPEYIPPIVEPFTPPPPPPIPTPPAPEPPSVMPPPPPEPARASTTAYVPPAGSKEPMYKPEGRKSWLWIVLLIVGFAVLGFAAWYTYDKYIASDNESPFDTATNVSIPEFSTPDTATPATTPLEKPVETKTSESKTTAKPMSKIDQELAKYREKEKNKNAQQTQPSQQTSTDPGVKITPIATNNDNLTKVILEVGKKDDAKSKKPKNPTKLTIQKPTMIVRITTDHYNDGMGTSGGGTITIKDRDENIIGTYRANGKTGKDGAPNAKWVAEPHKVLEKGTYFIWDSDFSTWSKNFVGNGFVIVEGYEIK